jgi:hypothetical protein
MARRRLRSGAAGHFFCNGFGLRYNVNSLPVSVNPVGGFNCYWPMPFRTHARITIENQHAAPIKFFFYQITYALTEVPERAAYFHGQHRLSTTSRDLPEHTSLEGVRGQSHYVGTFLAWQQHSNGWWGEGEIKFYMDGDCEFPSHRMRQNARPYETSCGEYIWQPDSIPGGFVVSSSLKFGMTPV